LLNELLKAQEHLGLALSIDFFDLETNDSLWELDDAGFDENVRDSPVHLKFERKVPGLGLRETDQERAVGFEAEQQFRFFPRNETVEPSLSQQRSHLSKRKRQV
jgi:hypothetical protein